MILTVTLNPSVDKTYILNKFEPNALNRAQKVIFNAGSKGINVSRVVRLLGQETCALGFVGGYTGEVLRAKLKEEGICHELVPAENFNTRLNVKILDQSAHAVTELNEAGDPVLEDDFEKLIDIYRARLEKCTVVVISGSILPEITKRVYYDLIKMASEYGRIVFLDCGGIVLKESLAAAPHCIKPNLREFEDMLGRHGLSEEDILIESRKIIEKYGIKKVIVTLGAVGAIGVTETESFKIIPPNVAVTSTVGAGDAFLAGVCYGYIRGMDFSKQLILGTSCASAKITKEGNNVPSMIELLGYTDGCRLVNMEK